MNRLRRKIYPLYFLAPGVTVFLLFFILPFFVAFGYSFTNWNFQRADFVGLKNYVNILTDPQLSHAFINTFLFTVVTTFGKLFFGMLLALFLNRRFLLSNFLRTTVYLPSVVNTIAIGIVFTALMHPSRGLLNAVLGVFGLPGLKWLTDPSIAMLSVCGIEIWKWSGYIMMILLAGLQNVAPEYYEAADIDGAGGWHKFIHVTFPLIRPAFNNCLILNIIGGLKVFDIVLATTGGGPGMTTQVINSVIYRSYSYNLQGEASAGTVLLAGLVLVITMTVYWRVNKKEIEL